MVRHLTARCQYGKFINAKYRREKLIKKINTHTHLVCINTIIIIIIIKI